MCRYTLALLDQSTVLHLVAQVPTPFLPTPLLCPTVPPAHPLTPLLTTLLTALVTTLLTTLPTALLTALLTALHCPSHYSRHYQGSIGLIQVEVMVQAARTLDSGAGSSGSTVDGCYRHMDMTVEELKALTVNLER